MAVPKKIVDESLEALSELASKAYKPKYNIDLSDLESPEQAYQRIYGTASEKPKKAPEIEKPITNTSSQAKDLTGTACLPCMVNHFSVCAGLLSDEAIRFARREGIASEEVIRRISRCQDQLNAMEREDLAVEKVAQLPEWEKKLASEIQNESAKIRHKLENITSIQDLEDVGVDIKRVRDELGKKWFKTRLGGKSEECKECNAVETLKDYLARKKESVEDKLKSLSPEQRKQVKERAKELIDKELGNG
jgi:hypothetical protein